MKVLFAVVSLFFFSSVSFGKTCDINVEANDQMQYNTKEIDIAKGCTEISLTLKHTGKLPKSAMGHNVVITTDKDMQPVIGEALKAGLVKDYIPAGDARIVAHTGLVGGGESSTVKFKVAALKKGETYKFFCTFPGHSGIMNGTVVIK